MNANAEERNWDFDDKADRYDRIVAANHPLYARYDEVLDEVVTRAEVSAGKRVLDIGTGTGNLVLRCLALGASCAVLDPSRNMLAKAADKIGRDSPVEFRTAPEPFLDIPFPDASFDAVISTYAFHHVPPARKPAAIAEMLRVLKPGGSWAIGDLIFENSETEKAALRQYKWLENEYFARAEDLRRVFACSGMELQAMQFSPVSWVLWTSRSGGHSTEQGERDGVAAQPILHPTSSASGQ